MRSRSSTRRSARQRLRHTITNTRTATNNFDTDCRFSRCRNSTTPSTNSNHLKKKKKSYRHGRCQRRNDKTLHQKSQHIPTTTVQQRHQSKRGTIIELLGQGDQTQKQERGPIITIQLPGWLLLPRLQPTRDANPSADWGCSTTQHLFTFQQLKQRAAESRSGSQPRLQKGIRLSRAEQRKEGLAGTRHRGTIHTASHEALRPPTCNSPHRRQKQTTH